MAFNPDSGGGVFSGFEGVTTPQALAEQRRTEEQRQAILRRQALSGAEFGAGEAGAFAGRALGAALRGAFPQTFDPQGVKARKAQEIIAEAQREVQDVEGDSPGDLFEARRKAVQRARRRARNEGLHEMADQLAGNEIALAAQGLEFRKLNAQVTAAEAEVDEDPFPQLARITEGIRRADEAQKDGRLAEAQALRSKVAKDAGISGTKVPDIIATVRGMGLDPTTGEGQELVRASILGAQKGDQRDRKINDLVSRGVDRSKAQDIVDGFLRMEVVPETGRVRLIDEVTQEATEVPVRAQTSVADIAGDEEPSLGNLPRPSPEPGQTLYELAELATGPMSALRAAVSVPKAWFGMDPNERVVQARQALRTETQSMVRSLAINPRFPVSEQDLIREEVNIQPRIWDDPEILRPRMAQINDSLSLRMQQAFRDANDPSLAEQHREAQLSNAANIANFLGVLGVDQARENAEDAAGGQTTGLPEGVPQGSQQIGTQNGNPVYETPDGQFIIVEP